MDSLITGAYDLHVHSAPDVMPRLMDDLDMIGRIKESGMAGYVIKSHYFCTAERASIINKMQSDCRAIGAITLNSAVGGINPTATTYYTIEEQQKLVSMGAYIEHCYTTWATKKVDLEDSIAQIKAIGADHVIIATDLGQTTSIYPDQGMLAYAEQLVAHGFSEGDVRKMVRDNPAGLIS